MLGITVINAGGSDIHYFAKLLEKLQVQYVCVCDRKDEHNVNWIASDRIFLSINNDFEADIFAECPIDLIIQAVCTFKPDEWAKETLARICGYPGCGSLASLESIPFILTTPGFASTNSINKEIRKWLDDCKGFEFGRVLAQHLLTHATEVAQKAIHKAEETAKGAV